MKKDNQQFTREEIVLRASYTKPEAVVFNSLLEFVVDEPYAEISDLSERTGLASTTIKEIVRTLGERGKVKVILTDEPVEFNVKTEDGRNVLLTRDKVVTGLLPITPEGPQSMICDNFPGEDIFDSWHLAPWPFKKFICVS
tara:strand:- start:1096 stop:1518 length:423 start_codon:yes stop_codon:yes gene_type:complete